MGEILVEKGQEFSGAEREGKSYAQPKSPLSLLAFCHLVRHRSRRFFNNTGGSTAMSGGILRPSLSLPLPGRFRADHPCSNVR